METNKTSSEVLEHIFYEMQMYLATSLMKSKDQFLINVLLESQRIHLRNLLYFFSDQVSNSKFNDTDIIYTTVIDMPEGSSLAISDEGNNDSEDLNDWTIHCLISRSIAHLTTYRESPDFKSALDNKVKEIRESVLQSMEGFLTYLPLNLKDEYKEEYEKEEIKQVIEYIEALMQKAKGGKK